MALVVKDRVKELTTTTGTADFTLGGAVNGFQSFSVIGNSNTTYYAAVDNATGDWEVGIGTYSTTGPTLTRDTVLESSNAGSKVVFAAGSKEVFVTYPAERSVYLDAAGSAVTVLDVGTLGVGTANITTANITSGTVSTTPSSGTDIANKTYVDTIASSGITYHTPVKYEVPNTTGNLNAIYNNGTGGVGATLTNNGTLAAFAPDGPTAAQFDRVLIYNQTNAYENGVYEVTTVGSGSVAWVLTRTADADSYGLKDPNALGNGDAFFVTSGDTGAGETYVCNTTGTITFGTTNITFVQVSSAQVYKAGTGLNLSPATTFNISNTGVTANTYGSASNVPVFAVNAQGQITSVTNTAISIAAGAVSGLAPSATTDTTNASNITSGTLPVNRLSGSYTGITGVGTLTAGTWNGSTIGAAYGGTGISSYAVGDILYADTATSLAKLADVVTGNALISGGVGTAPAWGKIGLQTHVSGTLQVANGGTGATDATGARSNLGLVIGTNIPSVTGTGASGTWGINITGNAATATTATTSTTATQVSNSVTFNNSGTGAASGNGFNGSSALTVSYNTVGAPSTTGANASGTWGISISGNAATATSATSATTATTATNWGSYGAVPAAGTSFGNANTIGRSDANGYTYFSYINSNTGNSENPTISQIIVTNGSDNFYRKASLAHLQTQFNNNWVRAIGYASSSNDWNSLGNTYPNTVEQVDPTNFSGSSNSPSAASYTYGLLLNLAAQSSAQAQIYISHAGNDLIFRGGWNGTSWQTWNKVLTNQNYNSYAPTLTGGGASGTWGINITGNAATATNASYAFNYTQGFNSNWNTDFQAAPAGSTILRGDTSSGSSTGGPGGSWWFQQNMRHTNSSSFWGVQVAWGWEDNANRLATRNVSGGSYGGWVYYLNSSNFTSYAPSLTGSGASGTWGINITGNAATASNASNTNSISNAVGGSYTWTGAQYFQSNQNTASGINTAPLQAYSTGGNGAIMAFHRAGVYAINMGLDSDNVFRIGGWSASANRLQMDMSGNLTMAGNIAANSDERLKKDWTDLADDFVEQVAKVKAGTYTRIDSGERQAGSSAQDWQKLLPEVVHATEDEDKTLSLAYGNAALVAAVKLAQRVVEQEARIARLEALVEKLIGDAK